MECELIAVVADGRREGERERYLPGTLPVPLHKVGREDPLMSRRTHVPAEAQDWRGGVPGIPLPTYRSTRFQGVASGEAPSLPEPQVT